MKKAVSWAFLALVILESRASAQLAAHVDVTIGPATWSYTLFNDEPAGSPNFLGYFTLSVAAPVEVIGTPDGWDFDTDGNTYVLWFNTDITPPYPHDIGPGTSLGGFQIQSSASESRLLDYSLSSWDHQADSPGPSAFGTVLAPNAVPEPGAGTLVGAFVAGGLLVLRRQKIRNKPGA